EAARFSCVTDRLAMVCSNRFWYAPRVARSVDTLLIAVSSVVMADWAPLVVVTSTPPTGDRVPEVVLTLLIATAMRSLALLLAPTWNTPPVPVDAAAAGVMPT